jgi:hypothetical protein
MLAVYLYAMRASSRVGISKSRGSRRVAPGCVVRALSTLDKFTWLLASLNMSYTAMGWAP